jgi:hypothetical protein
MRVGIVLPSRLKKLLPHFVAAFLVMHVTCMLIEVIPDLRMGLDRKAWKEPRIRHELQRWSDRLHMPRDDLEEILWVLGRGLTDARQALRTPFKPYLKLTAQKQAWAMFVAGSRFRDRFQIRARACGTKDPSCDWEVLYFRNDPEHEWMKSVLENARVRSATFRWGWPQGQKSYERGCRAIAWRVFHERSDMQVVECRFEQTEAPDPRKPDQTPGEGVFSRERVERRPS